MSQRLGPLLACVAMVSICLLYALFRQQLPDFWRENGGGIFYVLFWISAAYAVAPRPEWRVRMCVVVVLLTCGLEFLQLWKPEPLTQFRSTRLGAALLGNEFSWWDLPPYLLGGLSGWIMLAWIAGHRGSEELDDIGCDQ